MASAKSGCYFLHTVDGSEIPFPTTWDVKKPTNNEGYSPNINWCRISEPSTVFLKNPVCSPKWLLAMPAMPASWRFRCSNKWRSDISIGHKSKDCKSNQDSPRFLCCWHLWGVGWRTAVLTYVKKITKIYITLPETNVALENGWLEYNFPFGKAYFQVLC